MQKKNIQGLNLNYPITQPVSTWKSIRGGLPNYGFSLFEALVAIGIFLLATFAIAVFIWQGYQFQSFSFESERIISSAQKGIEGMVKEIREASQSQGGAYPIEKAEANEFIFFADFDRDNLIERLRYFLDAGVLKKGVIEPTTNPVSYPLGSEVVSIVSEGVRNAESNVPVFQYYNGDWPGDTITNPLATPADTTQVRHVKVTLRVNISVGQAPKEYELVSETAIRNLKTNL